MLLFINYVPHSRGLVACKFLRATSRPSSYVVSVQINTHMWLHQSTGLRKKLRTPRLQKKVYWALGYLRHKCGKFCYSAWLRPHFGRVPWQPCSLECAKLYITCTRSNNWGSNSTDIILALNSEYPNKNGNENSRGKKGIFSTGWQ